MADMTQPEIKGDGGIDEQTENTNGLVPTGGLGISRRQTALLVGLAVVAALVVYRMRQSPGGSADELNKVLSDDMAGDVSIKDDDDGETVEIQVPVDPSDELDKDAAVIDALKASGKMNGAS